MCPKVYDIWVCHFTVSIFFHKCFVSLHENVNILLTIFLKILNHPVAWVNNSSLSWTDIIQPPCIIVYLLLIIILPFYLDNRRFVHQSIRIMLHRIDTFFNLSHLIIYIEIFLTPPSSNPVNIHLFVTYA